MILTNTFIRGLSQLNSFSIILNLLKENEGIELYIAGGYVRDYFISKNLKIKDVDIFYKGDSEGFIDGLKRNGILRRGPFGSLRWFPSNEKNIYYDIISIVDFENGVEKCNDINDVLKQFDFTANSLAISLNTGEFFNPLNGLLAIEKKQIEIVRFDYPNEKISQSIDISRVSVLWFRLLHYSNKLKFGIEEQTFLWLRQNRDCFYDLEIFKEYFFSPVITQKVLDQINR